MFQDLENEQLKIYLGKKTNKQKTKKTSIKSFPGKSLQTWNWCSHLAQPINLFMCHLKPELLNTSKTLSSGS